MIDDGHPHSVPLHGIIVDRPTMRSSRFYSVLLSVDKPGVSRKLVNVDPLGVLMRGLFWSILSTPGDTVCGDVG
jgi:hypothetical protein